MFDPLFQLIAGILSAFYAVYPSVGLAIVGLTVVTMIATAPLTVKSSRSMMAMQQLQPEIKRLQKQYADDRQTLNEQMMALYKEHNINPLSGCLPMLLQLPFFIVMFRLIRGLSAVDSVTGRGDPKYLDHASRLYHDLEAAMGKIVSGGIDLAKSATDAHGSALDAAPFWILIALVAVTSYVQQWQMTRRNAAQGKDVNTQQQAIMKFMPLIFVAISVSFPAGVVLYMLISNAFRIGVQHYITTTLDTTGSGGTGTKSAKRARGDSGSPPVETTGRLTTDDGPPPSSGRPHPSSKKKRKKKKRR